nr:chorismate synthase [uncultured Porphyromonas sp.]
MNTFGRLLRLTTFGESHGIVIGGILDGFPSGLTIDLALVQEALERRRPGRSALTSPRREPDELRILSGIYEGRTTGAPIAFVIENQDIRSRDYSTLSTLYRPGHADYTYAMKYGIRDPRGGGRASARETAVRVVAGALASQWLHTRGVEILTYISAIGGITLSDDRWSYPSDEQYLSWIRSSRQHVLCCPDEALAEQMVALIEEVRADGDSVGGVISGRVLGLPVGLGEPLYGKASSCLASAMMSIHAVRGFEIGDGFGIAQRRGSEVNDAFYCEEGHIRTCTNHSGGLLGGITTGEDLTYRVAFKPTPSIRKSQQTVKTDGSATTVSVEGRHDPCVVLRAQPVVEAMTALSLMDLYLEYLTYRESSVSL